MRLPQILKLIPVSKSTWWAKVKSGEYPQPVKLSMRVTAWKTADIYALIESIDTGAIAIANSNQSATPIYPKGTHQSKHESKRVKHHCYALLRVCISLLRTAFFIGML
ncbi:MAG: AlpA family phage regulatory protein [Alphaproteobacteria bacterium]|nr:AlpA family phage regulatory protein [Alphaproteobacteria bacterium]